MDKKSKTSTDNQWTSLPEKSLEESNSTNKKDKTANDNQWTSTAKNIVDEK
ncbi:hypothetical protein [Clostridium sp. OS1-26]|uniref:hypothetical protein n=1 Tax=Clostridium sp. OS1-26 TaxID=3070681 RepID=UPI0027DF7999|nr:hypothetical protein [Clostridium sp. OS1-26]WML33946.1 hypothetical protein RCG18_21885 [Clostridium sp. OS1-26]